MSDMAFSASVGIPVKNSLVNARATLARALALPNVSEIILSISQPKDEDVAGFLDMSGSVGCVRIHVLLSEEPTSLFQNLSKILHASNAHYFTWLCEDDIPAESLFEKLNTLHKNHPNAGLFFPPLEYREAFGEPMTWGNVVAGPRLNSLNWRERLAFEFEQPAHRMYGIWSRVYLAQIFPNEPMDWFDHYILLRSSLERKAVPVDCPPMIIGVSFPNKSHAVNGNFLSASAWQKFTLLSIGRMGLWQLALKFPGWAIALVGKLRAVRVDRKLSATSK